MTLGLVLSVFLIVSCEKQEVLPSSTSQKQTDAAKALKLVLKGLDSTGLYQVQVSYRSPLDGTITKGILTISSSNGYSKKLNFTKSNFDMEMNLKEKGTYNVSILEITDSGNDYVETGELTIK